MRKPPVTHKGKTVREWVLLIDNIAILTNLMFSGSDNVRDQSAFALYRVNKRPEVIAALIRMANTETNAMLRANALLYLPGSDGPAEVLVPLGLKFLRSTNAYDRKMAKPILLGYKHVEEVRAALAESGPCPTLPNSSHCVAVGHDPLLSTHLGFPRFVRGAFSGHIAPMEIPRPSISCSLTF